MPDTMLDLHSDELCRNGISHGRVKRKKEYPNKNPNNITLKKDPHIVMKNKTKETNTLHCKQNEG